MRLLLVGITAVLASFGPAWAFDFTPSGFDHVIATKATERGASLPMQSGDCRAKETVSCSYEMNGLRISVEDTPTKSLASHVLVQAPFSSDAAAIADIEPTIAALCSPEADEAKRASVLFALQIAYENDEVAAPNVRVVLNGVRYLRRKMPDGSGELFEVDDVGSWQDQDRPAQTATASPPVSTPVVATPAEQSNAEPSPATTKEIVASYAPTDFKVADPADLRVAPRKFLKKPIEVRHFHCYYADVGDYRCVAPGFDLVAVFTGALEPDPEKDRIENDCGAMKALMTPKCERTLHLVVDDFDVDRIEMRDRITLRPKVAIVLAPMIAPAPRKKR